MGRRGYTTARKSTGGKAPRKPLIKKTERYEHRPSYSTSESDNEFEQEPIIQFGKIKLEKFEPNFKAKLQVQCCSKGCSFNEEELSKAFEEIVSCINKDVKNLKRVLGIDWKKFPVYKQIWIQYSRNCFRHWKCWNNEPDQRLSPKKTSVFGKSSRNCNYQS